jgi:hypothetical protein
MTRSVFLSLPIGVDRRGIPRCADFVWNDRGWFCGERLADLKFGHYTRPPFGMTRLLFLELAERV